MTLATLAGVAVTLADGNSNPSIKDAIGQRSTAKLTVWDDAGTGRYQRGTPVELFNDTTGELVYGGVVLTDSFSRPAYSDDLLHDLDCTDWHYLADKRIVATSYSAQTCGFMVNDVITNWLAAEGVYAVKNILTANQSDVETDTTGFVSAAGATLTRDTTQHWHGSASLKIVTPGAVVNEGAEMDIARANFTPGMSYMFSVYAKGAGTVVLHAREIGVVTLGASSNVVLNGSTWTRLTLAVTMPSSLTADVAFQIWTGGPVQATTFYADGFQIEPMPDGNVPDGAGGYAANVSPWELGGTSTVQTGPTLAGSIAFNYKRASDVLDKLAQLANFIWWIDKYKRLYFVAPATNAAPWTYDGTQSDLDGGGPVFELTNPLYRNGQWILGTTEVTAPQTETRQGDGKASTFTFSYPIHEVPSALTVNGVAKTIGIKGVDSGKDFYWSKGDPTLAQDSAGVKLISTDTLSMTYKGEYKTVAFSQDGNQVNAEAALEGVGTGLVEDVQTDTSLVTSSQAFQLAASYLTKYATSGETLTFRTKTSGLAAGQLLAVALPGPWNVNDNYLIESVGISFDGVNWWYDVSALSGPVNDTWVQFLTRLAGANSVLDSASTGAQQSVALLAQFTAAWNWAATLNVTVYACPLFPWTFPVTFC